MSKESSIKNQNFCVIIPVFKHLKHLQQVLPRILPFDLSIIVIDDGNPVDQKIIFDSLVSKYKLHYVRHEKNRGKGASVYSGLKLAKSLGYSHAIQIDADGQHEISDLPKFIHTSLKHPASLILGTPIFDSSAPRSRVWGRKLTNWLVAFETLNLNIADALFGYRVYPVSKMLLAYPECKARERMGFDVESIVRYIWAGHPVENISTPVKYPVDGYSNFRYLEDNVGMIFLHVQLILEMLIRIPLICIKKVTNRFKFE